MFFSRGGSMAERFALLHPELVQAVAALSGGAYTVPQNCITQNGTIQLLPLPLGTADLQNLVGYPLRFTVLPGIGHAVSDDMVRSSSMYLAAASGG
jgi:pimeloyl-ACP methyl ester carboxylesterase